MEKGFDMHIRVILLAGLLLAGCDVDENVVPGAKIEINPPEITWNIDPNYTKDTDDDGINDADCIPLEGVFVDNYVAITAFDSRGGFLTDADIRVNLAPAGNSISSKFMALVELYDDKNGNGVVDGPEELVSDTGDEGFVTTTDSRTGDKFVILRTNVSCPSRGVLSVFVSGGVFNSIPVTIQPK